MPTIIHQLLANHKGPINLTRSDRRVEIERSISDNKFPECSGQSLCGQSEIHETFIFR